MFDRPIGRRNIFREVYEKYDRRVRKITENPDPALMRSNWILYKHIRDQAKLGAEVFESKSPVPVIYYYENAPTRLFRAMGFMPISLELNADHLTQEQCKYYFKLGRSFGYTDNICDRVQLSHAVGISGDFPPPAIVFGSVADCDLMSQTMASVARYWEVPLMGCDLGFKEEDDMGPDEYYRSARYALEQLKEFITFCETRWPDFIKYDEDKLEEYNTENCRCTELEDEVFNLIAKARPSPISGRDALRLPIPLVPGHADLTAYVRTYRDEVKEKIAKGITPVKGGVEKMRLYWLCSAPFFEDPFTFLEDRGIGNPLYEEGMGAASRYNVMNYEEAERRFGRRMSSPLEEEAALFASHHWGATGNRRINELLHHARLYGIDGMVHYELEGCLTLNGIARVTGEIAEKELGIKSFYAEDVHCQDMEKFNEPQFEQALWDWVQVCLAEKEARELA